MSGTSSPALFLPLLPATAEKLRVSFVKDIENTWGKVAAIMGVDVSEWVRSYGRHVKLYLDSMRRQSWVVIPDTKKHL